MAAGFVDGQVHRTRRRNGPERTVAVEQRGAPAVLYDADLWLLVGTAVVQPRDQERQAHDAVGMRAAQIRGHEAVGDDLSFVRGCGSGL